MEKVLDFVSSNYIWFIVAGSILLIIALLLLLTKKKPVKEEKPEPITEEIIEEPIVEEVKEPVVEEANDLVEEFDQPIIEEFVQPVEQNDNSNEITFENIVDAQPVEEKTETLDIVEEVQMNEPINEPIGEVNIQNENLNTDNITTTEEDIWKF